MYINNPNIKLPNDPNTIVWKYLDLSKFLDLLLSQQLFMSRSDKFEDQYEGTFSEPTYEEIKKLSEFAHSLGLEVLLEVHNQEELEKSIMPSLDMIGVNNRNLKTFEVSLDFSKTLADQIPNEFVKVSESGISSIEAITELKPYGYQGFLIGENFMKTDNAGQAAKEFIAQLV